MYVEWHADLYMYMCTQSIHKFHGESRSEVAMHHLGIKVADCSLFIGIQGLYFGGYETAKGFLGGGAKWGAYDRQRGYDRES